MEDFTAACYLVELTGAFIRPGDSQPAVYELLKNFLSFMDNGGETNLLCRFFEVKLLSLLGYMPGFEECVACGDAVSDPARGGMFRFSASRGGLLCRRCEVTGEKALDLSVGTARFLQAVDRMAPDKLHRLRPGPLFTQEAGPLLDRFIKIRLGHGLKTKSFMEQMQNLNPAGS